MGKFKRRDVTTPEAQEAEFADLRASYPLGRAAPLPGNPTPDPIEAEIATLNRSYAPIVPHEGSGPIEAEQPPAPPETIEPAPVEPGRLMLHIGPALAIEEPHGDIALAPIVPGQIREIDPEAAPAPTRRPDPQGIKRAKAAQIQEAKWRGERLGKGA